ncbi:MAG TPA: DUF3341 domain-containing protein [Blastocatellia bacterium]|nr:DUF3341 domain-containing protein [Blastocatellia bacterium]
MEGREREPALYGLIAEFDDPAALVAAARRAVEEGYRRLDAYTPYPIEELTEALRLRRSRLPLVVLLGGIAGGIGGYALLYWTSVIDYPLNVGGRPLHSWPAFIPITFETTVLIAALSAVLGLFALSGLPMPHHPVFNAPNFALASRDRFFLCIEATDPKFDYEATRDFLNRQKPREVTDVES